MIYYVAQYTAAEAVLQYIFSMALPFSSYSTVFLFFVINFRFSLLSYGNDVEGLEDVEDEERTPAEDEDHHHQGQHPHHLHNTGYPRLWPSHFFLGTSTPPT